jgi:hypothetical protein
MLHRPSDECPYPKPFGADFRDCPAFHPRQFIPLDTLYQPLEPVITCRHLVTRSLPERYRWYAACAIGDAEARRHWANNLSPERLERMRTLQRSMAQVLAPQSAILWDIKGQQLRALRDGKDTTEVAAELRRQAENTLYALDTFLTTNEQGFTDVDLPLGAVRELIHAAVDQFLDTHYSSEISFEVPDELLEQFPASVRSFFRPPAPAPSGSPAG